MRGDFDEDLRYCAACRRYVRYLLSLNTAYCVECGDMVKLFSEEDERSFRSEIAGPSEFRLGPPSESDQFA